MNISYVRQLRSWGALPIPQQGKRPLCDYAQLRDADPPLETIEGLRTSRANKPAWPLADSIGIVAGRGDWTAIDIDFDDRAVVDQILTALGLPLDYAWLEKTGRGYHLYILSADIPLNGKGKLDRESIDGGGRIELRYHDVLTTIKPERFPGGQLPDEKPARIDQAILRAAYDAVTIAPPEPERFVQQFVPSDLPSDASELLEVEARTRAAIASTLHKRGRKPGYYACPLEHGSEGKDFLFSPEAGQPIGGCQGRHEGELTRWMDLADHLEIDTRQIARDVARERRPDGIANLPYRKQQDSVTAPRRFDHGQPHTLNKRMLNAHKHTASKIKSQHPAALVWAIWQELGDIIPDDAGFTAGELQRASEQIGRNLSRDTSETGLLQLLAWNIVELCDKCNLPTSRSKYGRLQKSQNPGGRPAQTAYRFLPLTEQLANFERHYAYLLREKAYRDAPDNVQPEYAVPPLSPEECALGDAIRQPVYEKHATGRQLAARELERGAGYLTADNQRILEGRYNAVLIPVGPLPNSKAYRDALHRAALEAKGGVREEAYKAQFELGVSRSALPRIRKRNQVITEQRTAIIPGESVTEHQRLNRLVLAQHDDGSVTVKLPSAERFADMATPEDRAAYEQLCVKQRAIKTEHKTLTKLDAPAEQAAHEVTIPDLIPAAYSEDHVMRQFEYTPGADGILRYPVDTETGEIDTEAPYTPAYLWRQALEQLRAVRESAPAAGAVAEHHEAEQPADNNSVIEKKDALSEVVTEKKDAPPAWTNEWKILFWQRTSARGIPVSRLWQHTGIQNATDFFATYSPVQAGQVLDQLAPRAA